MSGVIHEQRLRGAIQILLLEAVGGVSSALLDSTGRARHGRQVRPRRHRFRAAVTSRGELLTKDSLEQFG